MSRAPFAPTAATFLLLFGCAGTSGALLRVRPAPGDDDGPDTQRAHVEDAVRDVAALGRLSCEPPKDPGRELLGCWPGDPGASPAFVSLHLRAAEAGYEVSILESFGPFSRPRNLCSIHDRLAERLEVRLRGAVVERDPGACRRKTP